MTSIYVKKALVVGIISCFLVINMLPYVSGINIQRDAPLQTKIRQNENNDLLPDLVPIQLITMPSTFPPGQIVTILPQHTKPGKCRGTMDVAGNSPIVL